MIISATGTQCIGKTTFITDFKNTWKNYKSPEKSYRDFLKAKDIAHSENATKETQEAILDSIVECYSQYDRRVDNVIIDRCPIDNLAYTLWLYENGKGGIDDKFIEQSLAKCQECLRKIDVIFFFPITGVAPVELVSDGFRSIDPVFRSDIDMILKAIGREWQKENSKFYVPDDKPAWIEIFGKPFERIEMVKLYLDADGDVHESSGILDPYETQNLERELVSK